MVKRQHQQSAEQRRMANAREKAFQVAKKHPYDPDEAIRRLKKILAAR